jgi:hypothetical protein
MSLGGRRTIPLVITFLAGMVMLVEYFFKVQFVSDVAGILMNFGIVIAAFALGLGAANLLIIHGRHIKKRTPKQWYFSAWLFVVMFTFIAIGVSSTVNAPAYVWLFQNTLVPVSTTTYSLLAFFIASAAYRAFRFRTMEGAVLLVSGVILMLGNIPMVSISIPVIADLADWINKVPTMAGLRAILIGAAVGTVVLGVRTFLGQEKGYMGGE